MPFSQLCGWVHDPVAVNKVSQAQPHPTWASAASMYGTQGLGAGKRTLLYPMLYKALGGKANYVPRLQTIGDCFEPTALVRMADGSEKQIKDVVVGDEVLTPQGNVRKVIDTIKKPYDGKMVRIHVTGYKTPIEATPDHRFMHFQNVRRGCKLDRDAWSWQAIAALNEGDHVLLPKIQAEHFNPTFDLADYCEASVVETDDFAALRTAAVSPGKIRHKGSPYEINRYIPLGEKLAWLLGLYAAEGSADKAGRITFNLSSKERTLAEQARMYIKGVFDADAIITQVPSKPTVLYVRLQNKHVTALFKSLCPGNVWNKQLCKSLLVTTKQNKLHILLGWLAGDGHQGVRDDLGVSVSKQLIDDMFQISNSLGIVSTIRRRKPYKQSKESHSLSTGLALRTGSCLGLQVGKRQKYSTTLGRVARISKIEIVEPSTDHVYCIGVEHDHAFICNGYGVHNCVSHGAANAVDILRAIQTATGKGQWLAETASEVIYALSRVEIGHGQLGSGDGSVGAWAAEACRTYGTLLRQVYGKYDLTKYDGNRAKSWGMPNAGLPNDLEPAAHEHLVRSVTLVKTWEDLCDAIAAGYPVTVASNQGFTSTRDSEGFARPSGTWGHQMVFWAADDLSPRKGALIENSWGPNWITGPTTYDQPPGSFWADKSVVEHMLAMQDSWAYSDYEGFPPKQLDLGEIF